MPGQKWKIGLALGSGAARGLAHVGILKVLEEAGVRVDYIAGTSIGAFIGALYAAGMPVREMETVLCELDWRSLPRLLGLVLPKTGLIDGKKVATFMAELLPVRTFEELHIPLAMTATDLDSGEALVIRKGSLLPGLQAATAFPGIFPPVLFGERYLVDGGLCNPVPADVAYQMGADKVIGVCSIPQIPRLPGETFLPPRGTGRQKKKWRLGFFSAQSIEKLIHDIWHFNHEENTPPEENTPTGNWERKPPGIFQVCSRSVAIMENQINAMRLERDAIDLLIRPEFKGISMLDFHRAAEAIKAGETAARAQWERIRELAGR
jgi:NTE family protein